MNPYLIAAATGAGFFGAKKLFGKIKALRKLKLTGIMTVSEFRKKRDALRKQYADNKEVIALLNTIDELCETLRDEDEITIG